MKTRSIIGPLVGVCSFAAAAGVLFAIIATKSDENDTRSRFQRQMRFFEEQGEDARFRIVYDGEHVFGDRREATREWVWQIGHDQYKSEKSDSSGYTITHIRNGDRRFQCESSSTIPAQCYKADKDSLRSYWGDLDLDGSFAERAKSSPTIRPVEEVLSRLRREWEQRRYTIESGEVLGEPVTCFIEQDPNSRYEHCYASDGVLLSSSLDFELGGSTVRQSQAAIDVSRDLDTIEFTLPHPLLERPILNIEGDNSP
jgi:hypothetical protein